MHLNSILDDDSQSNYSAIIIYTSSHIINSLFKIRGRGKTSFLGLFDFDLLFHLHFEKGKTTAERKFKAACSNTKFLPRFIVSFLEGQFLNESFESRKTQ
ncbi:hypothetical protein OUZ56_007685 [Daphnia magna]|uniref:Uncharacterized protein n=1 Tax=Daphnia magna TaxID=35525 RepID=A0ABR0AAP4_9CRUS|nr:hypothetical protein OUZ56_007685 [Daphnia magna]